jgi:hypothetical protein
MDDLWQLFAAELQDRVSGPMKFRIVLQPIMATYLAIRSGLTDAKSGAPPYLWSLISTPGHRKEMIKDGWKSLGRLIILAMALDLIYQFFVQSSMHLRAALIVAFLLAIVPYLIVRGTVTRIANALMTRSPTVRDSASVGKAPRSRDADGDRT